MTPCQLTAFHGGSVQAAQVLVTQNTLIEKEQKLDMQTQQYSMEAVAQTASSAKTGNTETYLRSLIQL